MKKEQLLTQGFTEEQATKILTYYDTVIKDYIPKVDYTALETTKTTLEGNLNTIERNVAELLKDAKGSTIEEKISSFQTDIVSQKATYEKSLKDVKFANSLEKALSVAKAKNPTAVKALLKLDNIKVNDDGSVLGLDEQIKAIKESDKYLFEEESNHQGTGGVGNFGKTEGKKETESLGERLAKQSVPLTTESDNPYFK